MALADAPIELTPRPFCFAEAGLARWRERSDIGTGHTSQRRESKTHADRDSQQETLHDLKCARLNVALQVRFRASPSYRSRRRGAKRSLLLEEVAHGARNLRRAREVRTVPCALERKDLRAARVLHERLAGIVHDQRRHAALA